jgi:oxygen-dependent protoporphyrinogen oxidase
MLASMLPRVIVVGAGISGLSAAHRLLELEPNWNVSVFDAAQRAGGLIRTEQIDGCVVEQGPDAILTEKPAALQLAERLNLQDQLQSTNVQDRGAYLVNDGKLERIPQGFSMMAATEFLPIARTRLLSPLGKVRLLAELLLPRGPEREDESVASFVTRRFGPEVLERLAQPLMSGIYGTDPNELSLASTMPRFIELERRHRSVTLGLLKKRANERRANARGAGEVTGARYGMFVAFKAGNQTLIDALSQKLGTRVQLGQRLLAVSKRGEGFRVHFDGDRHEDADAVILALPASAMAPALLKLAPLASELLAGIGFGSTATVAYAWRKGDIPHPLDAFGFVVPRRERCQLLASTWASKKFAGRAPAEQTLIRVFFGGERADQVLQHSDQELTLLGREELGALIGVKAEPLFATVCRQSHAMPRYNVGHKARVAGIERALAGLTGLALAGNSLHGVGIPDAITSGERGAERVRDALARN